ncbi:MAG: hypothetical protein MUE40_13450 [Anaerolineae bacterium]|jgi:hypothetical protein|nr:hypothetical protein [Anaerolineae bacterium]
MDEDVLAQLKEATLPPRLVQAFCAWCVWQQAVPALMGVLEQIGLTAAVEELRQAQDYAPLAQMCERIGGETTATRRRTGPLGVSTAEAALFLVARIARAADGSQPDADGVAFYAAQVMGWGGFAATGFTLAARKTAAESEARQAQAYKLRELKMQYPG